MMKKQKFILNKEARCETYRLLAQSYHTPDENSIETFKNITELAGRSCNSGGINSSNDDLTSLLVDHAKLFVGPYQILACPYGSIYLENAGMVMGESTINAMHRYAESGLNVAIKEVPDHIAIELEFMYFLIFKEIEQTINNNLEKAAHFQIKQKEFLDNHLGRWVSIFADRVVENAGTNFYKSLAIFTKKFIRDDMKFLLEIVNSSLLGEYYQSIRFLQRNRHKTN